MAPRGLCSSVPAAAPAAADVQDVSAIPHSPSEIARMDSDMEGLAEPLLKWYKIVRMAPQPTFERRDG